MPFEVCTGPAFAACASVETLADALAWSGSPKRITVPEGVHEVLEPIDVDGATDLTLVAAPGASPTITTSGARPVFDQSGGSLRLDGVSAVKIGNRVFVQTGGSLSVVGGSFYSLGLVDEGGVLFAVDASVEVRGATFQSGLSVGDGGLLAVSRSTVSIEDTTFRGGLAQRGGAVWVGEGGGPVVFRGCTFQDNEAIEAGGALAAFAPGGFEVSESRFLDNRAPDGGAAALTPGTRSVRFDRTEFVGNVADHAGGAVWLEPGSAVAITRSRVLHNTATHGAGMQVLGGSTTLDEVLFCGNVATDRAGAVAVGYGGAQSWRHLRFVENTAAQGGALFLEGYGRVDLAFASFLGNQGERGSSVLVHRPMVPGAFTARGLLVGWSSGDMAVRVDVEEGTRPIQISDSLWFENLGGHRPNEDAATYVASPELYHYRPGEGCDALQDGYRRTSPLRDLVSTDTDPDGTPADAGAWGGYGAEGAEIPALWQDLDGDEYEALYDCDDSDASVHPEAKEVYHDGVDQDCSGDADNDEDRDGWPRGEGADCDDQAVEVNPAAADAPGEDRNCDGVVDGDLDGYQPPEDCDDGDPNVHPGAPEDLSPGVDADCDGFTEAPGLLLPVRCDQGGAGSGLGLGLAAAAGLRRRRRD